MKLFTAIYKGFSYIFLSFIVALIIITFGMPDFITTSATSDRYIAARVGEEVVTRLEIDRATNNYIREYQDGKITPEFRERIKDSVFEQLIDREILLTLLKEVALFPIDRSRDKIMAYYLKKNFSSYFSSSSHDFEKFNKEVLQANRISLNDLEKDVIDAYALNKSNDLLDSLWLSSNLEKLELWRIQNTKVSYYVAVLQESKVEQILKKNLKITEKEIQQKFKKDYVSKDPKATLTRIKIDAIKNEIFNQKKGKLKADWHKKLKQASKKKSIQEIASSYGIKSYYIQDVPLNKSLESYKPKGTPPLHTLQNSKKFRDEIFQSNPGEVRIIQENKDIYLITWVAKESAKIPSIKELIKNKDMFQKELEKRHFSISSLENELKKGNESSLRKSMTELEKEKTSIKRFMSQKG